MNTTVMERSSLVTITGTVLQITAASGPRNPGKIKLTDGKILKAFPDKLQLVQDGGSYTFQCAPEEYKGVITPKVLAIQAVPREMVPQHYGHNTDNYPGRQAQAVRPSPQPQRTAPVQHHHEPAPQNGNGNYRPTHPRDAERMFCCSILNAFIQTGRINNDVAALTDAVTKLRQVWQETFGLDD